MLYTVKEVASMSKVTIIVKQTHDLRNNGHLLYHLHECCKMDGAGSSSRLGGGNGFGVRRSFKACGNGQNRRRWGLLLSNR